MEKSRNDLIGNFVGLANQLRDFLNQQNQLFLGDFNAATVRWFGTKQAESEAMSTLISTLAGLHNSLDQFDRYLSQIRSSSLTEQRLTDESSKIPSIKEIKASSKGCVLDIAPPKKQSKHSTKSTMTSIEIKKDFFSSLLQMINTQRLSLNQGAYRKLVHNTFDLLPYISQKLSYRATHEEFYVEVLTLIWQLINLPEANLAFPELQYPIGIPAIIPFRYGTEGSLKKQSSSYKISKKAVCKGAFCFYEDEIHSEAIRLTKKIYVCSNNHLVIQESEANNDVGKDQDTPNDINFLYKALKRKLAAKTVLYKTNFLTFLIGQLLEKSQVSEEVLKSRSIKNAVFETEAQRSAISEWENQMLRLCRFLN